MAASASAMSTHTTPTPGNVSMKLPAKAFWIPAGASKSPPTIFS